MLLRRQSLLMCLAGEQETVVLNWNKRDAIWIQRNKKFTQRTIKQLSRLPREAPSLEFFTTRLNNLLSNVVWMHCESFLEQEVGLGGLLRTLSTQMSLWFYHFWVCFSVVFVCLFGFFLWVICNTFSVEGRNVAQVIQQRITHWGVTYCHPVKV